LTPRFSDEELATIQAAAEVTQLTLTGFCALAALAAARRQPGSSYPAGTAPTSDDLDGEELAEMQREIFAARVAVNKAGASLNQAVAQLNATGVPPVWLERAVSRVEAALDEVDAVASRIHRRLG
jgi:hypothetical protein